MKKLTLLILSIFLSAPLFAQLQNSGVLNEPLDISKDFTDMRNTFFVAEDLASFDPATGKGTVRFERNNLTTQQAFNNMLMRLMPAPANEFPGTEYAVSPEHPFSLEFVSGRTVRIRMTSGPQLAAQEESLMLVNGKAPINKSAWQYSKTAEGHEYKSEFGRIVISESPWHIRIFDAEGKLLTQTIHTSDVSNSYTPVVPFSYIRRASDYSRSMNAVLELAPGEKIYGLGESWQSFNKRGEKVVLWTDDANGVQNETMYKPIPFYMSSRGYGVFMHHSSPISIDFGKYYSGANSMMIGDDELDLFVFLGEPKDILDEYTDLTGKAPMPPLWSFGFWMSRITYFSEKDGMEVAAKLREHQIPSDVIHFDTGWFGVDWRNDYTFPSDRFPDPKKMLSEFKDQGFEISLWQLPYFTPENILFDELVEKDLVVRDRKGNIPYEDAVLDFTNPATIEWYQEKIKGLLDLGVAVIKVDFGEAAPEQGIYHNGKTGFYEHNIYPLRYNKAVAEITKEVNGDAFIWARSAWAGSQRYPVHWGGDAETSNSAMAATLRGGLSFGLSGFSFWSHDIGGFTTAAPEDLYARWTPFGMLSSHVRSHGNPPTEPWEYGTDFMAGFREADNLRYELMPYIYAQAKHSSETGLPMVRALFVEFPEDPGSWLIDDEYLFGEDILVAPMFENGESRDVYLPPGQWVDYQTGQSYSGGWHNIATGDIPVVMMVRDGAAIPHIALAQTTKEMDWKNIELKVYSSSNGPVDAKVFLPGKEQLETVELAFKNGAYGVAKDPYKRDVKWKINASKLQLTAVGSKE
ncbi:TIM-barrel domain-containing protein [Roseivirga pacifica]|uniref:glycoside hydrolase family 31 protein n=1 Tax=Roseivirga pacifica TaxID=1267423 RepID=UPI003BAFABFB